MTDSRTNFFYWKLYNKVQNELIRSCVAKFMPINMLHIYAY